MSIAACTQDIRSTFTMSEKQYGMIATLYLTGSYIVPGFILDRYGPVCISSTSAILAVCGHGAVWLLAQLQPFPGQEYLLYISFFCAGLSFAVSQWLAFCINLSNFQKSAHGKVMGCLCLSTMLGAAVFNQVYTDLISPNLSVYFGMITIFTGSSNVLMVFFLRKIDKEDGYTSLEPQDNSNDCHLHDKDSHLLDNDSHLLDNNDVSTDNNSNKLNNPFRTLELYLLLTVSFNVSAVYNVILFMTSTFTMSLGFGEYTASLITMSTIMSAISNILGGFLSDYFLQKLPRMHLAVIPMIALTVALFLAIFYIDIISILPDISLS